MIDPKLEHVPETMLWPLHNRADEAKRPDSIIDDPHCLEIYNQIDYDYTKSFGAPDGSHGLRSKLFDEKIEAFLAKNPDGVIVNLGEGLETQRYRVHSPDALWICVDLPESIAVRELFIQPDEQHLHLAQSALDFSWMDAVPQDRAVFVSAQGLLMYFTNEEIKSLICAISEYFEKPTFMFDYIPTWLSKKTMSEKGWMKTPNYRTPEMPWGINRPDIAPTFSRWLQQEIQNQNVVFLYPRGLRRYLILLMEKIPALRNKAPGISVLQLP